MTRHVRGIRSIPRRAHELIEAGRNLEQLIEDARRSGLVYTVPVLRDAVLGGLGIRRKREGSENVVVVGCACYGTLDAVWAAFHLLDNLGIDYTLLEKEYCCGAPMIAYQVRRGENRREADLAAKELIAMNINQARELGAKRILYLCSWCIYLARQFYHDCDVEQLYYLDKLDEPMRQASLRLSQPTGIAYFPGGQHRSWVYVPKRDWELNWSNYRAWLDQIDGLEVLDIPRYCCVIAPDAIFQYAQKYGMSTLVTPCMACYGRLQRRAPKGEQVKFLADLLLEALQSPK